MKTNDVFKFIDGDFLEKVYRYAYGRCNTSHEAEDLCSKIILRVIAALRKQAEVENFYAFVWAVARRVYADHCEQRSREGEPVSLEDSENFLYAEDNELDNIFEEEENAVNLKKILYELTFLSKAYRDVMVMYYLEEMKVKDIAARLGIAENTVKQRLFSARNEIRKEVSVVKDKNLTLKPIKLAISGTGNPVGNDPRKKAERMFSQNLIYLCKDKPKSAKELSEELCVPMPYVEEELEIQVRGENGRYGMLRKLPNGKYITNVLLVDYKEYDEANKIYEKHLPEIISELKASLEKYKEEILAFPYLSAQSDIRFILWSLISKTFWIFEDEVGEIVEKYFEDIEPAERPFSAVATAFRDEEEPRFGFYGCDGIDAYAVGGYKYVFVSNIYGNRIEKHIECGDNISNDGKMLMLIKSIGGLGIAELDETEKEIAAKAVECGYIRKNGDILEPNVIAYEKKDEKAFFALSNRLQENMGAIKEAIAEELAAFMKAHIPEHLMGEYRLYVGNIAGIRILSDAIEECIKCGLLTKPKANGCEGVVLAVEK